MTSKWQRVAISDYLFALLQAARTKRVSNLREHAVLLVQWEFSENLQQPVNPHWEELFRLLGRSNTLTMMQWLDLLRAATVFCPCKSEADWGYLSYLIRTYYYDILTRPLITR
jgi:hypothetical protein